MLWKSSEKEPIYFQTEQTNSKIYILHVDKFIKNMKLNDKRGNLFQNWNSSWISLYIRFKLLLFIPDFHPFKVSPPPHTIDHG